MGLSAGFSAVSFTPISDKSAPSYWFLRVLFNADAIAVDKDTFCDALIAEGVGIVKYYQATPFMSEWYQKSIVFGDSKYPWAAPEYTGDKNKRYTLADLPIIKKTLDDTFMLYPYETWTEENIAQLADAFRKVYNAYKK